MIISNRMVIKLQMLLKKLLNTFVSIILLLRSLIFKNWYKNIKKILNSDLIIFHVKGGFGHQIEINDLARRLYKSKEILYICKLEQDRHNQYLANIFGNQNINILSTLKFKFFNKQFYLGEKEGSNIFIIENFYYYVIKNFFQKKIIKNLEFYETLSKDFKNKFNLIRRYHRYDYINLYFHLYNKEKNLSLQYKNFNLKTKKNFFKFANLFKKKKICIFYLKYSELAKDITKSTRSGSRAIETYFEVFEFLISKNFKIFLLGDLRKDLFKSKHIDSDIFTYKSFRINKDLFDMFAMLIKPDLFIGECGGPLYFGFYAKKAIGINWFPYGYKPPGYKHFLRKKIYDMSKKKIISEDICDKIFPWQYKFSKKYKIYENTSSEILNILKVNL
jgi:putative glycosyltransferase (TIGR04372 family)